MSVRGLCQICESREGEYTCDLCGSFVCAEHFDREANACVNCARRGGVGGGRSLSE